MAQYENTREVSVSCEDDAGDILQPNMNLRSIDWTHTSSELITEGEIIIDQEEICESIEEIVVDQENVNYVTCLGEECMEESIVYVFEEPVVEFDLSEQHYIIDEPLTYDIEVAEEGDNMNSNFSEGTNKNESSHSGGDEEIAIQPNEIIDASTIIIENVETIVGDTTKVEISEESIDNSEIIIDKCESGIELYSTSKKYSVTDNTLSDSNDKVLQSHSVSAENSDCCETSEVLSVNTESPVKLAHSLYGDDDPVTNTFVATLSSSLTPKHHGIVDEQKTSDDYDSPPSPRTPVLQNTSPSVVAPPSMLPSVLNRNKLTPVKKTVTNLNLELPILTEQSSVSADSSSSKDSPLPGSKISVLGKEQIKKRLQSFSLLKQGIQSIPIKKIINVKQPKIQVQISDEYDENGKKLDEKLVTIKKPPKQGSNPQEKAKAVINEIEQIKREEAARLENNYLLYHKHNFPTNSSYSIKDQTNPEHLLSKKTKAALVIVEKDLDDGSKTPPHKSYSSKDKKYGKEHSKSLRRKSAERDKSEKKKHEHSKDERMPKDWAEVKKLNYEFKKIAKLKEKTLKSLIDSHKSPDKRCGNHRRSQEDDKNVNLKKDESTKPQLIFEYPSLPRHPLIALSVKGKSKYYPPEIVKYTEKYPTVSYCENPNHANGYYRTRKQVLSEIPAERSELMLQIIENKIRTAETPECFVQNGSWYPAKEFLSKPTQITEKECVISYGLSVLSQNYNDDGEENADSSAEVLTEEKDLKTEESVKSNKDTNTSSKKSKKSNKNKHKSKSRSKSREKTDSQKKSSKSKHEEDTKISSKSNNKIEEENSTRSLPKPDMTEDKTPNTEEYRSNWESDEDLLTEIMRPTFSKSYHRSDSMDKKWDSEEEVHEKYDDKRKHDNKYVEKRSLRRSSLERISEERNRRRSEDKRKSRNSFSLEERVSDNEERHSHSSKHSHQNVDHRKSSDFKHEIEDKPRRSTDYLAYNKWSSEEDVNRSVSSKYDNRNKRNDSQKSEKKDTKDRSSKPFEDLSSMMLTPGYNHRKSQWSEDEEFERRKIAAEFAKRSRHNYEGKLSKHDEIRMSEKEKQSKHDELRMLDREKQSKQLQKIDDRLKSRWEEEFKQLETAKYRNKERHEDIFEKDPKDLLNLKEYERKHLYLEEFQEKSNRDDFEHRKSHKGDTKIDKYREEKSKGKEKKKYTDKKPKVTINYSDLEDNLDEEFRSDKKPKKELSLFKEENVTRSRPKIKIDYSDFDMSLIESKDKFEENIYSRTLHLNSSKVLATSINFDVTKNIDVNECLESVKATGEAKQEPHIIEIKKKESKIEKEVVSNDATPTKDETNIQIDSATPVKSQPVQTIPEVSPVAPPVLLIPVPSTKLNPPGDQLASAYEEFMKAVFSNEPTEDTPEESPTEVEQPNEQKQILDKFKVSEKLSPLTVDKDSERSEIPSKDKSKETSASSNESSSETESSDSEDQSDESSDESSDTNSETSTDVNQSIKETVKNIKTEVLSDSEKEHENERKVKSDKRKRCDKSDVESSNDSGKEDYNLSIVIKAEKENLKKTKKNDPNLEHDESKYKNVIDWETSYSGSNTGYVDMFKAPEYLVPLKLPIIDITEMATSAVLPENIPLPNDFNISTVQNIPVDAELESPKHIPNILDPQTPSPKKSRSLIPIKLLTAENRKQANETVKDLTKTIVTSNEISINTTVDILYENLEDTDLNLSRKRQSQWNMNLTPAKKLLLQNNVMGDDSDEDFTDKFIKQSDKMKPSDKDYPKKSGTINNDHFDIVSKDGEHYVKLDYEKSKVEAEHNDNIKAAKHETDAHKEQENDKMFNKDSHDRSRHSAEHKVDKNSDPHRSDRRSSSVVKSDRRSSRRSSHERRDKDRGRESMERKRERSRERSNRESQRDRGRKRMSDRRYSDRKPGLDKGRIRYSRERELNRYRGRERSKERGRFRDQDRGRDRSMERGRNRSPDRPGDRIMERGRDRSPERMGDRSIDRMRDRSIDRIRDRSPERIRGSLDRTRERSPNRIRERTPERMRDRTPERMRDRTPERIRDRTPDRIRDRSLDRTRDRSMDRGRDRSPDMLRGRSPIRLRDRTPDRIMDRNMERGRSPNRLGDRSLDRVRDRSPDRFRDRSPERIMDRGMDRGRDRSPDRMRDRSVERLRERSLERLRERSLDRYRERDHRDSERYPPRRREDPRRYSRSPSPSRRDRRSIENIPMPCRTMPDDTDFSATSMDIVHSPVNSPLDGFKRSLADSTISDSELIAQLNTPDESNEPLPAYSQMQYYPSVQDLQPSKLELPSSPKRISLDDRINLVLGIEKEPPKQIDTVCTRGPYNNNQTHYHDPYAYSRAEFDMYNVPPPGDLYGNSQYPNQYQHQPYYPSQLNNDNNIKVLQVGNVIQVVPTEQAVLPPPIVAPVPTKVNELPPKVVQVGNMLQIVPMTMIDNTTVASPLATVAPTTIPPVPVAPIEKLVVPKSTDQLALERRAEKEKRRLEREQRRKEKEKKRREKEKRKQLKNKLKTENMIKRALMLETGEGELDIINAEPDVLNETTDSNNLPLPWPPASMLSTQPLPKPPAKGILVTHGFRREKEEGSSEDNTEPRRVVKFADGICPGEGTSPSGGEELPSPPPPPRKLPKEKRYKKLKNKNKKKIKVKIIRTQQPIPEEDEESEDNLPPPPPPPGSPPPHLWPPRIKQPPVNNIHPSLPGNVYPPNPYPPQQVMYPAAYSAPGPQQVPVVIGHAPPQGPRHHHSPAMPVMQHGPPQHIGPPPQHVGPPPQHVGPPTHHATHHVPAPFHH
ncbi:hypothetical protein CBL_09443 [Carabus blaptoides fortunei]